MAAGMTCSMSCALTACKERKGKEAYLYSAFLYTMYISKRSGMDQYELRADCRTPGSALGRTLGNDCGKPFLHLQLSLMCRLMAAGTSKEHLGFAVALGVPSFVVVTKTDACRAAQVEKTLHQLERTLKGPGCRRVPLRVDTEDDACTAASNFHSERCDI